MFEPVLTKNAAHPEARELKGYLACGGYQALRQALKMEPAAIEKMVTDAGLRGRGGAGFPTGKKWSLTKKDTGQTVYLVVNFDESEPGTFKDRYLCDIDPHLILEGVIISAFANFVRRAFIFIRGEYLDQYRLLEQALAEARAAGYLGSNILGSGFDLEITLHRSAGAYICGEETGMLEGLEGKRGWPRLKPPYPAVVGVFREPTVINNIETLACVPMIVERGPQWFAKIGTPKSSGPKLLGLSGHVNQPGIYELAMGITCGELIEKHGGGVREGKKLKGVIPGGASTGVLTAAEMDCPMDFEGPVKYGCLGLGTACAIVMDEETDMVRVLRNLVRFFAHESCGQCIPCREGSTWMLKILDRLVAGQGRAGDLELLLDLANAQGVLVGKTICGLADGTSWATRPIISKFRPEFEARIKYSKPLLV